MANIQHVAPILETSFWTKFDPQNWSKLIRLLNTGLQSLSWLRSIRSMYNENMQICDICTFKTMSMRWWIRSCSWKIAQISDLYGQIRTVRLLFLLQCWKLPDYRVSALCFEIYRRKIKINLMCTFSITDEHKFR